MEYLIDMYKKANKGGTVYSVDADSLEELRGKLWHTIRQTKMKSVRQLKNMGVVKASLPDDASIIMVYLRGRLTGAVILVPGVGTYWGTRHDQKYKYWSIDYTGKIKGMPVSKL